MGALLRRRIRAHADRIGRIHVVVPRWLESRAVDSARETDWLARFDHAPRDASHRRRHPFDLHLPREGHCPDLLLHVGALDRPALPLRSGDGDWLEETAPPR